MKTIEIVNTVQGLKLMLYGDGEFRTEVRADSHGYFEGTSGFPQYGIPYPRYPEERLIGQTELESDLKHITEISALLWHYDGKKWIYRGFPNDKDLDYFLSGTNQVFDELRELLRGKCEVIVDCHMEREYWISGKERKTEQKKRIKLMFDIMACPLWIYDENGRFFANAGVCDDGSFRHNRLHECKDGGKGGFVMAEPLLEGQTDLMNLLNRLADEHDDMYEGERFDFQYCKTMREAEEFAARLNTAWRMLNTVLGGKYKLELAESLDAEYWYRGNHEEEYK